MFAGPKSRQISSLTRQVASLNQRIADDTKANLDQGRLIVAIVLNAPVQLNEIFDGVKNLGPDESDACLQFVSNDALSRIFVYPADRQLVVVDPHNTDDNLGEPELTVYFDAAGKLNGEALRKIRAHQAAVAFNQRPGARPMPATVHLSRRLVVATPATGNVHTLGKVPAANEPHTA
jgi:hypothetical protein